MFIYQGQQINIHVSYGVSTEGVLHLNRLPEGVDGVNYPANTGPLSTIDGRTSLGVTEQADSNQPFDSRYYFAYGVPRAIDQLVLLKLQDVNGKCDEMMRSIEASYPESEVKTWTKQEEEAKAYLADNQVATPLIDALVANRGLDKAELITRILAKAQAFAVVAGTIVGVRQAHEDALHAFEVSYAAADAQQKEVITQSVINYNTETDWPAF